MPRRTRGSGEVFQEGNGWAVRWREPGRRRYRGGFTAKALADRWLAVKKAELAVRRSGLPADHKDAPTLSALAGPWLERREATHAAGKEDGYRWNKHLAPHFGHLRPDELDTARLRAFVELKRGEMKPGTLRVVLAVLSSLYEDLLERGVATRNPARHLPKSLLRLVRPDHDPKTTPFIEKLDDVRRVYLALPEPLNVAYAIGALAGLRTGEVFALRWRSVDVAGRRIMVSESVKGQTKDRDPRPVPILDPLLPVLEAWKLKTGGEGLVIPPLRSDGKKIDKHTPGNALRKALGGLRLARSGLGWYEATRHTFASQWAMAGRPLRELQAILGHSSIAVTEKYAHLAPGYFAPGVHSALSLSLAAGATVRDVENGQISARRGDNPCAPPRKHKQKAGAAL